MEKRLFIVSNRLPITVDEEKGVQQASGGLITAVSSYLKNDSAKAYEKDYWSGVPGCTSR